ncbi:hypothetical protein [Geodermatophilus sp. SYSU D01176]
MQLLEPGESDLRAWDAAVAQLVRVAVDAEARLARLVRVLTRLDHPAAAVLLPAQVSTTADVADRLVTVVVRDPRLRDDLRGWVTAVTRLCRLRDTVVHTVWERGEGDRESTMWPVWSPDPLEPARTTATELRRTLSALSRRCGPASDELLLRLDKSQPELEVYSRV